MKPLHALALAGLVLTSSLTGCMGDDEGGLGPDGARPDGPAVGPVTFRFDPTPGGDGAIPLVNLPYPNDLHIGGDGTLNITVPALGMPLADPGALTSMSNTLRQRRGFGVTTGVLFPVAGLAEGDAIDPATLTRIKMIALPSGTVLPVTTHLRVGGDGQGGIYVAPSLGVVLEQGSTYAILIDRGVRTLGGIELGEEPGLAPALADGGPEGFRLLREHLAVASVVHDLVAATQFTTDRPIDAMLAARAAVQAATLAPVVVDRVITGADLEVFLGTPADNTQPGRDNPGGIAHASISAIVLGHFTGVDFLSADARALGAWELDAAGAPMPKGTEEIPFVLAVPAGLEALGNLKVAVFQHGLNGSRQSVLDVANRFCAAGIGVIGIDIPFHGARFPEAEDVDHNFTDAEAPDGLADDAGFNQSLMFFDISGDAARGIAVFDPNVMASVLRQTAVDFMTLARMLDEGDWSAVATELPGFSIDADRLLLSGESFGSITGALAIALEPRFGAFFLSVGGGGLLFPLLSQSPNYWPIFGSLATALFGLSEYDVQPDRDPPQSHLAFILFQSLLEAGDPLTYAPLAHAPPIGDPKHVVLAAAQWDESVSNASSEALAGAIGLELVPMALSPAPADAPRYVELEETPAPVSGNVATNSTPVTAAIFYLDGASHGMITSGGGDLKWQPPFPPFVLRDPRLTVVNPIADLQDLLVHVTTTYYETGIPEVIDTFGAP